VTLEEDVRRRVVELIEEGLIDGVALRSSVEVLDAIPVADPSASGAGLVQSWFVPVAAGDKLAGFAQIRSDLELIRYSSFPHEPGGSDLPDLRDWIDPDTVRSRAEPLKLPDETLDDPVLTYDREPSRLAWAVTATAPDGSSRRLLVTGAHVSEARPAPDEPETGEGPR
jgi:hypothetical protein